MQEQEEEEEEDSRVVHHHLGSLASELDGNRGSNTSPGASHQGDLAIQAEWHVCGFNCTHGAHCDECVGVFSFLDKRRGKMWELIVLENEREGEREQRRA